MGLGYEATQTQHSTRQWPFTPHSFVRSIVLSDKNGWLDSQQQQQQKHAQQYLFLSNDYSKNTTIYREHENSAGYDKYQHTLFHTAHSFNIQKKLEEKNYAELLITVKVPEAVQNGERNTIGTKFDNHKLFANMFTLISFNDFWWSQNVRRKEENRKRKQKFRITCMIHLFCTFSLFVAIFNTLTTFAKSVQIGCESFFFSLLCFCVL